MSHHTIKRRLRKSHGSKTRLRRGRRPQRGGGDFKKMANKMSEQSESPNKEYYLELAKDLLGRMGSSRAELDGASYSSDKFDIDAERTILMDLQNKFKSDKEKFNGIVTALTQEGNNSSRPEGSRYFYSSSNVAYENDRKRRDRRKLAMTERDRASTNFSKVKNALVNLNSKDAILKELLCNLNSSCKTEKQTWPLHLEKGLIDGAERRQWLQDRANAILEEQVNLLKSSPYATEKPEPWTKQSDPETGEVWYTRGNESVWEIPEGEEAEEAE